MSKKPITRLDYCQHLMVSQTNYTLTYYADHQPKQISHDRINGYLRNDRLTPSLVWEKVKNDIVIDPEGYLIFDDSIPDKNHSHKIELVNKQYSGNAHGLIKGICLVNCVYINPKTHQYWIIDYRIYDKATDGKSKPEHLQDMLKHSIDHKKLDFKYVLMDTWYATKDIMLYIDSLKKIYYCPLKSNRKVDDSKGLNSYKQVSQLTWTEQEQKNGKLIKYMVFQKTTKCNCFGLWLMTTARIG